MRCRDAADADAAVAAVVADATDDAALRPQNRLPRRARACSRARTATTHTWMRGISTAEPPAWERELSTRAFTVGIGGPVCSGRALTLQLCRRLRERVSLGVVTNDIFKRRGRVPHAERRAAGGRIRAVETGGCPHAAIREDVSANPAALEELTAGASRARAAALRVGRRQPRGQLLVGLADFTVYVIDVAGGDKVPRKGGGSRGRPARDQQDRPRRRRRLRPRRDGARRGEMRGDGPTVLAAKKGDGLDEIEAGISAPQRRRPVDGAKYAGH